MFSISVHHLQNESIKGNYLLINLLNYNYKNFLLMKQKCGYTVEMYSAGKTERGLARNQSKRKGGRFRFCQPGAS